MLKSCCLKWVQWHSDDVSGRGLLPGTSLCDVCGPARRLARRRWGSFPSFRLPQRRRLFAYSSRRSFRLICVVAVSDNLLRFIAFFVRRIFFNFTVDFLLWRLPVRILLIWFEVELADGWSTTLVVGGRVSNEIHAATAAPLMTVSKSVLSGQLFAWQNACRPL